MRYIKDEFTPQEKYFCSLVEQLHKQAEVGNLPSFTHLESQLKDKLTQFEIFELRQWHHFIKNHVKCSNQMIH